jgi:hypothetical protein
MRELSSDQRQVLLLRMAGGLTFPEVAELLGKTTGAVKALQHRGLAGPTQALARDSRAPTANLHHPTRITWSSNKNTKGEDGPGCYSILA